MKRLIAVTGSTITLLLVTATSALAQGSELPPPGGPQVKGDIVTPPGAGLGGLAFTGSQLMMLAAVAVALLAIGIAFVMTARRRAYSTR